MTHFRDHVALTVLVTASRLLLGMAGLPFLFSLDWMWMCDPGDLRDHLFATLYSFHAFPPGMNLLTGVVLKIGGAYAAALAQAVFFVLSLLQANAMLYLGRAAGLSAGAAFVLTTAFLFTPPAIYFEHLFHYEWPVATLMCLAAAAFFGAVRHQSTRLWTAFFATCSTIALTRSTFHLVWFVAMVALAWSWAAQDRRRRVLVGASVPALVLLAVYAKNLMLVGEFAASTFGPAAFHVVTADRLPVAERDAWIAEGRLSPYAAVSAYAAPRDYLRFFPEADRETGPPALARLERPSVNLPNFNHWLLVDVHRARRADAVAYVTDRPLAYLSTAASGLRDLFGPTTEWHPFDRTPQSAHAQQRPVLGWYETRYNRAVHGWVAPPIGLYVVVPVAMVWAFVRQRSLGRAADRAVAAQRALLIFCLIQIAFVVLTSSLFTFRESSRYRFQIEWLIWLVVAWAAVDLWTRVRHRRANPGYPGAPTRGTLSGPGPLLADLSAYSRGRPLASVTSARLLRSADTTAIPGHPGLSQEEGERAGARAAPGGQ